MPYHSCHAPDISACAPFGAQNDFRRAILSSLYVVGKVMPYPACISQVGDLDGYSLHGGCNLLLALLRGCALAFQRDSRNVLGEDVSMALSVCSTPQNHIIDHTQSFPAVFGPHLRRCRVYWDL